MLPVVQRGYARHQLLPSREGADTPVPDAFYFGWNWKNSYKSFMILK